MSRSLLETYKGTCFICGRQGQTEKHHIFGSYNRKKSEEDGLYVYLCHNCHNEPPNGIHFDKSRMELMRKIGQRHWESSAMGEGSMTEEDARRAFMERYGRNYL